MIPVPFFYFVIRDLHVFAHFECFVQGCRLLYINSLGDTGGKHISAFLAFGDTADKTTERSQRGIRRFRIG